MPTGKNTTCLFEAAGFDVVNYPYTTDYPWCGYLEGNWLQGIEALARRAVLVLLRRVLPAYPTGADLSFSR